MSVTEVPTNVVEVNGNGSAKSPKIGSASIPESEKTRQQAIVDVTTYIEIFYNRQRIQKGLGFKSPAGVSRSFIVRLPDIIYQVFYSVVDSRGQSKVCR